MPPLSPAVVLAWPVQPCNRLKDAYSQADTLTVCQACDIGVLISLVRS